MQTKNNVLVVEVPAGVGAKASTVFRGVIGSQYVGTCGGAAAAKCFSADIAARKYTVGEAVVKAEDLVVPEAGIKGDLGDDIGRWIERVGSAGVVAFAVARLAEQEVVGVVVQGERGLRVFYGDRKPELIAEVFGYAKAILARVTEPDVVTRVDRLGPGIVGFAGVVAGADSPLVFGHQTPHLAAEEAPAIIELGLSPCLAQTERVAVGLGGGGGDAGERKSPDI